MNTLKYYLLFLCCVLSAESCFSQAAIPEFFKANYTLYYNGKKIGLMARQFFKHENGHYSFQSNSQATGLVALFRKDKIFEESQWYFANNHFMPSMYRYQYTGGKKDRDIRIDFDWHKNRIDNYINGSKWSMPSETQVLDKLLYQLVIMAKLKAGEMPNSFTVADGGKIKQYLFEYMDHELVTTPLGQFNAIKIIRKKPNSKHITKLWCATALDFLPIKVVNIEKAGKQTSAVISSLNGFGFNHSY